MLDFVADSGEVPMIILIGASSIVLAALQATISAPTDAFRGCLRESAARATSEKVSPDAVEAYLKAACAPQMASLKSALVAFRMKNGMTRKAADSDAEMTVDDYVSTPVDNYKFMADLKAGAAKAAPEAKPAPTPASVNTPPPKP